MKIFLEQTGKKFYRHWIFRNIDYTFSAPNKYAILGANGSGKSTLVRLLAGMHTPSTGKISYELYGKKQEDNTLFHLIAYCAPGMELVEEMTLKEFLHFHFSHKKPLMSLIKMLQLMELEKFADKEIGDFSSGMKQRVKLAQAIFADTPLLLLDEPCTNLDEPGLAQYNHWIENYTNNRLVIVASNDVREYFFCTERLEMSAWK